MPVFRSREAGMSDTQLFHLANGTVRRLEHTAFKLEKELQRLVETHLLELLGVRFLKTEYETDTTHAGRIDTVGLDENNNPVVIEYKRGSNENVITQGLYYLDWLVNHEADFRWLVMEKLGKDAADAVDWSAPRLVCIAESFNKFDGYAVKQINRHIQLLTYRHYPGDLLALELVGKGTLSDAVRHRPVANTTVNTETTPTVDAEVITVRATLEKANADVKDTFSALSDFILSLGDDVELKALKQYFAFRKLKNIATVVPLKDMLYVWLKLEPILEVLEAFTEVNAKDVRSKSHWGTGDFEIELRNLEDLEVAKPLLERAYAEN
jgi:predicted transport protein